MKAYFKRRRDIGALFLWVASDATMFTYSIREPFLYLGVGKLENRDSGCEESCVFQWLYAGNERLVGLGAAGERLALQQQS